MARDIAFVAEKDTPEDAGETFRETRPLPEGPRSEGVPATPDVALTPAAPDNQDIPTAQADAHKTRALHEPAAQPTMEARDAARPEPERPAPVEPDRDMDPELEPDLPPREPSPEAHAGESTKGQHPDPAPALRTEAVERAFAEARAIPDKPADAGPAHEQEPPPADPSGTDAAPSHPASPPLSPAAEAPVQEAKQGDTAQRTAKEDSASASGADDNPASFTSAVEGLFRPSETSSDDTHLITTGRRFNPSLSVPAPVPQTAEPQAEPLSTSTESPWKRYLWTGARYAAYAVAGYLALVLLLIILFRFVNPPGSMLMLTKLLGGTAIDRTWVPFEAISPALARAVIVSEDSRFCAHRGIDMQAMRLALEEASRGAPRGASTISMQVTKNLFLWNAKSYLRKVVELPLTLVMEVFWPKKRILEVYLNIAEWGPGVFGAEAAARHHFDKPASKLTEREAALLAAALPNPAIRVASNPGPRTSRMARVIQARVRAFGSVAQCVVTAPPPAPPAAAKPKTPARTAPARKPPATKKPQQKQESQDWAPTLRFGP